MTSLSAESLQRLLHGPLGRLGIPVPDLTVCSELAVWCGLRPGLTRKGGSDVSDKPERYMASLRSSLAEVDEFWGRVVKHNCERADSEITRSLILESAEHEIFSPLRRLRQAMDDCTKLVAKRPDDFEPKWEDIAFSLSTVFRWIVDRSGSNARSGLSKGGPSMTFIMDGLEALGWRHGTQPTEDAVLQYLKRRRREGDI